ncbi:MAG: bis-aminopropyl spermidine synthase family protein [Oligoflexales bacterium]
MEASYNSFLPNWEHNCLHICSDLISEKDKLEIEKLKRASPPLSFKIMRLLLYLGKRDHTYQKFIKCPWEDIIDIIHDQALRNSLIPGQQEFGDHTNSIKNPHINRRYNQQPCTLLTVKKRVEQATLLCGKSDPILVLGDDDLIGIELAKAGFTNVCSVDIDPSICRNLNVLAKKHNLPLKTLVHDIRQNPPEDFIQDYRLVFIDPMYSLEGISMFLEGAFSFTKNRQGTLIFLSLHLMSLLRHGIDKLPLLLDSYKLTVMNHIGGFNTYPIPYGLWFLIKLFNRRFMKTKTMSSAGYMFRFFLSDAILLKKESA